MSCGALTFASLQADQSGESPLNGERLTVIGFVRDLTSAASGIAQKFDFLLFSQKSI
jgi:hypothetical protein